MLIAVGLIISYSINAWVYSKIIEGFLGRKSDKQVHYIVSTLGLDLIIIIKQFSKIFCSFNDSNTVIMIVMILYLLYILVMLYQGSWLKKLFSLGILCTIAMFSDIFTYVITSACLHWSVENIGGLTLENLAVTIISSMLTLGIYEVMYHLKFCMRLKFEDNFFEYKEMAVLSVCNVILSVPALMIFNDFSTIYHNARLVVHTVLVQFGAFTVLSMCDLYTIYKKTNTAYQAELKAEKAKAKWKVSDSAEQSVQDLKELRHDMRKHFWMIEYYVEHDEFKKLKEYVRSISDDLDKADNIFTNIPPYLSILISEKLKIARSKGIQTDAFIKISEFGMRDRDLNVLFSNILDNAIEAAEQVKEAHPYIDLEVTKEKDVIQIKCSNSANELHYEGGELVTTKEDKANHGFGMTIIKNTVRKYGGKTEITYENREFTILIHYKYIEGWDCQMKSEKCKKIEI